MKKVLLGFLITLLFGSALILTSFRQVLGAVSYRGHIGIYNATTTDNILNDTYGGAFSLDRHGRLHISPSTSITVAFGNTTTMKNIIPASDNLYSIGTTGTEWFRIFTKNLYARTTVTSTEYSADSGSVSNPAFGLNGTTDIGMWFPATNTLAFSTKATEGLRIDSSQNVGVGTTTPGARLHSLSTAEQLRLGYDGANYVSFTAASDGQLSIAPTNSATTTVSSTQFLVGSGAAATPSLAFKFDPDTGFYSYGTNQIGISASGTNFAYITADGQWNIWGRNNAQSNAMVVREQDGSGNRAIDFTGWDDSGAINIYNSNNVFHTLSAKGGTGVIFNETANSDVDFRIESVGEPNIFFVDASANTLGSGTSTPAARLHIVTTTEQLRLGYDAGNYTQFTVASDGQLSLIPSNFATTTVSSSLVLRQGSAANPSLSFVGESDSGMFLSSNNNITWVLGGTNSVNFGPNVLGVDTHQSYGNNAITLKGYDANDASAIGVILNNNTELTTAGGKLVSVQNAGTEKAFVDKDGGGSFKGSTNRMGTSATNTTWFVGTGDGCMALVFSVSTTFPTAAATSTSNCN